MAVHKGTPFAALATANRFLLSAASENTDLFVHSPMSRLIGSKLAEAGARNDKIPRMIDSFERQVDFPDVRRLINGGKIGFRSVLRLRDRATRFRDWLQEEGERDRDALLAYHREVASGWAEARWPPKVLSLSKLVTPAVAKVMAPDSITAAIGAGVGSVLIDTLNAHLSRGWSPYMFGQWSAKYVVAEVERLSRARGAILGIDR